VERARKKVAMTTSKRKRPSDTTIATQKESETDPFQFLKDLDDTLRQTSKSKFPKFSAPHLFSYRANAVESDLNMYATEHLEPRNDHEHVPQQTQSSSATTTTTSSSTLVSGNDTVTTSSQIVTASDIQELKMLMGKVYTITKRSSKDLKVRHSLLISSLASHNGTKRKQSSVDLHALRRSTCNVFVRLCSGQECSSGTDTTDGKIRFLTV
jgi:hypothetical protein